MGSTRRRKSSEAGRGSGGSVSARSETEARQGKPVFGLVLFGGPLTGATVSDMNLANELSDRGFPVHVWWAMDRPKRSRLRPSIRQYWLFSTARYWDIGKAHSHADPHYEIRGSIARALCWLCPESYWIDYFQQRPHNIESFMKEFLRLICEGVEQDGALITRFARQLSQAGVTHVMPTLAGLCPWVLAARRLVTHPFKLLVTFKGYEVYANYVWEKAPESLLYKRLRDVVNSSDWPAIAVSQDYRSRVIADVGVPESSIRSIPVGVPPQPRLSRDEALRRTSEAFPAFRPELPLITYLGRRDAEKGIDLLLYAASMLRRRGIHIQLAVCGPTLHGGAYTRACRQIARNLRYPVFWRDYISRELRAALFTLSRAIVYPSIYREAFGMVPVEVMAHGTPVIVPDFGGIVEAIQAEGRSGGVTFRCWDSGHLAEQIERVLKDQDLWQKLSEAGPFVAEYYSLKNMTDRILSHMGVPLTPAATRTEAREAASR